MKGVLWAGLAMGVIWLVLGLVSGSGIDGALSLGVFCGLGTLIGLGAVVGVVHLIRGRHRSAKGGSVVPLDGPGTFRLAVVGESSYQGALEHICGPRCEEGEHRVVDAVLVPEKGNKFDDQAVYVEIAGRKVGYLTKEHARGLRSLLANRSGTRAACRAEIRGGWSRDDGGDLGHYGVWLDVNLPAEPAARVVE